MKEQNSSGLILLVIFVAVAMLIFGFIGYTPPKEAVFDAEGFYSGTTGKVSNPKELYDSIYLNVLAAENACHGEMTRAENAQRTSNGTTWIVDGQEADELSLHDRVIKPYTALQSKIVAPADMTFLNSNVMLNADGEAYIEARLGADYIIRWEPVDVWWCHMGKSQKEKHTSVYGAGGEYSTCVAGWVIGKATENTEVRLWHLEGDRQVPIELSNYFCADEPVED
ncbi:MAG: hypothetical protein K2I47_01360 [Odoribacter sp.]|nr:hypothetical protein [Odoribacter sp.]